jgi:phage terminase large subunit-like protein
MGLRGPRAKRRLETAAVASCPRWLATATRDEQVIQFSETLPCTKGVLQGQSIRLLEEQKTFFRAIYGEASQTRLAIQSYARGNGKTGLQALLVLAHMFGPVAEQRGEIYSAGIDRQQSGLMFNEVAAIIEATPEFAAVANILRFHKRIEVMDGPGKGTVFEALSADARRGHGLAPSVIVADEVGTWKSIELLDTLMTGMGKRVRSLAVVISTQAGDDQHPFSLLIDDALRGLDPSIYIQLLAAPPDADPFDEQVWRACNPALGVFLSLEEFRAQAARAKRVPTFEAKFRNLRLNQRVCVDEKWLSDSAWQACRADVDLDALVGEPCVGGLDLGSTRDLTSFALFFERSETLVVWTWCPAETVAEHEHSDRVPYTLWARQGHIELTPGRATDKRLVALRLGALVAKFNPRVIAFDRWGMLELERVLRDEGLDLPLKEFGMGFKDLGPATAAFEIRVLNGHFRHTGNPLLAWALGNVALERDAAGAAKPSKRRSHDRIDPIVAAIMAVGMAAREPEMTSAYDDPTYEPTFITL